MKTEIIYYANANFFRVFVRKYAWQVLRETRIYRDFVHIGEALSFAMKVENYGTGKR